LLPIVDLPDTREQPVEMPFTQRCGGSATEEYRLQLKRKKISISRRLHQHCGDKLTQIRAAVLMLVKTAIGADAVAERDVDV
jgi:hypothetical protein